MKIITQEIREKLKEIGFDGEDIDKLIIFTDIFSNLDLLVKNINEWYFSKDKIVDKCPHCGYDKNYLPPKDYDRTSLKKETMEEKKIYLEKLKKLACENFNQACKHRFSEYIYNEGMKLTWKRIRELEAEMKL